MVLAFLLLIPVLVDIVSRPSFRSLAFRNISRRKGEAVLVILGGLLGTAIITAAFIVGDTIDASFRDSARTNLGPADVALRSTDPAKIDAVEQALRTAPPTGVDGTIRLLSTPAVAATTAAPARVAEPHAALVEADFDAARRFGADPAITGFADAGATPSGEEAVINDKLAASLGVRTGDRIELFAYGASRTFTVRTVVPEIGLAGYAAVRELTFSPVPPRSVFVAPGTIASMASGTTAGGAAGTTAGAPGSSGAATPPNAEVLLSVQGGLFPPAADLAAAKTALDATAARVGNVEVAALKADVVKNADALGASIGQLYTGIGGFSVIAGVLLLVNLFVMLAEERKVELGMLRALGFKRNHIVRTFAIEGGSYSVVAALLGGIVGIGVGAAISRLANAILTSDGSQLAYQLAVEPASLVAGIGTGLAISLVTVWGTSLRISRLNVIRSIRDLPEPATAASRLRGAVFGGLAIAAGALLLLLGVSGKAPVPALLGPALAAFGCIPVLSVRLPRRPVVIGGAAVALLWAVFVFQLLPDVMGTVGIESFVVQGVILVGAAITILQQLDGMWSRLAAAVSRLGNGLTARLSLAYPLARRFRTGMLLAMYSLVIFTMTFLSVFSGLFAEQEPTIVREVSAGYDLIVDSSPSNPISAEALRAQPGVAAATTLRQGFPAWIAGKKTEPTPWPMTGVDDGLLVRGQPPKLSKRRADLTSDAAAYRAVMADPSLALVPDFFLQSGGGPPESVITPGDKITAVNPQTQERRELTVVGVVANDFVFNGVFVSRDLVDSFIGPAAFARRSYVSVTPGTDADELAARLNGAFIPNGADADSFRSKVGDLLAQNRSFFGLMNGYLGLGLVIGIAGLGVVMVRAVRERRRQIGMLRAMGFSAGTVRRSFLLEAAFVAFQGSVLGIALALVTSYQVLAKTDVFGSDMAFAVPWGSIGLIFAVPFVASLLATAAPAAQAARIKPAVALRIAD